MHTCTYKTMCQSCSQFSIYVPTLAIKPLNWRFYVSKWVPLRGNPFTLPHVRHQSALHFWCEMSHQSPSITFINSKIIHFTTHPPRSTSLSFTTYHSLIFLLFFYFHISYVIFSFLRMWQSEVTLGVGEDSGTWEW